MCNMKNNSIIKNVNIVFTVLMIISFSILIYFINKLNITPFKYNIIIYSFLGFISILFLILMLFIKNRIANIIFIIIEIICIIISCVGIKKIITTNDFFNKIKEVEETSLYYVIINKDSKYKKINNLIDKNIGYLANNSKSYKKAINKLKKVISYKDKKYENISLMINDLYDKKIDAIIINSASKDMIDEYDTSFKDKTSIIHKISITEKVKPVEVKDDDDIINILISGIDTYGDINNVSRSDVNIIMTVNPNTHEVLLTSIPRDTYVQLHDTVGLKDKLTHSGIYGIDMTRKTIEDFLNIQIDYYVRVNFTTLTNVVDALDGVDVYSDQAFSEYGYYYSEGINHLDGKSALMYARIRHVFAEGDKKRGEHQKQIIEAIINKVSLSKTLLSNYEEIINSFANLFQTNIPTEIVKSYVREQLDKMPSWKVESISVDGVGKWDTETYSMPGWALYVLIPDETTISNCSNLINGMKKGKKIADLKSN